MAKKVDNKRIRAALQKAANPPVKKSKLVRLEFEPHLAQIVRAALADRATAIAKASDREKGAKAEILEEISVEILNLSLSIR